MKKAAIVTLHTNLGELEELAESAGYEVLYEIVQRKDRPDPSTFVGKGKLSEIGDIIHVTPVDVVLINGSLKPSQHLNLERRLGVECVDRIRLVLNIFAIRASSREAKLQVERATLKYEIPFIREWIHNAKAGEHPGFLAGGEYEVDVYYDLIRKRMKGIDDELEGLRENQNYRRVQRRRRGFYLVGLVGYTNAGKSSLLNALTGEKTAVDGRMFSTLSSLTRKISELERNVLLTDTIGFLDDLPLFMIESFKNTIEDVLDSDLILLVLDASDSLEEMLRKMRTSLDILLPEVRLDNMVVALNKIDLVCNPKEREELMKNLNGFGSVVQVSALTGEGLSTLRDEIGHRSAHPFGMEIEAPQSPESEALIHWLRGQAEIARVEYTGIVRIMIRYRMENRGRILDRVNLAKGKVVRWDEGKEAPTSPAFDPPPRLFAPRLPVVRGGVGDPGALAVETKGSLSPAHHQGFKNAGWDELLQTELPLPGRQLLPVLGGEPPGHVLDLVKIGDEDRLPFLRQERTELPQPQHELRKPRDADDEEDDADREQPISPSTHLPEDRSGQAHDPDFEQGHAQDQHPYGKQGCPLHMKRLGHAQE